MSRRRLFDLHARDAARAAAVVYAVSLYWAGYKLDFSYRMAGRQFGVSASTVRRWHNKSVPLSSVEDLVLEYRSVALKKARSTAGLRD